jgi:hypothetical protein
MKDKHLEEIQAISLKVDVLLAILEDQSQMILETMEEIEAILNKGKDKSNEYKNISFN